VKDNSIHMSCILAPTTFSYSLNVKAELRAKAIKRRRSRRHQQIVRLLQRRLCRTKWRLRVPT